MAVETIYVAISTIRGAILTNSVAILTMSEKCAAILTTFGNVQHFDVFFVYFQTDMTL